MNTFAPIARYSFFIMRFFNTAFITILLSSQCFAQQTKKSAANGNIPAIEQRMIEQGLVDIQKTDPNILVELKYSTTDNFIGRDIYGDLNNAYLQPEMAARLSKASNFLQKSHPGYRLLVYDAARPNSAQYDLWNALDKMNIPKASKTQYVADPRIGSNHNFGCAIDLTVVDEKGKPLDMGTKYDFFGPLAYPRSEDEMLRLGKLTARQITNRKILRTAMTQAGFKQNTTEWWHFDGMSKKQAREKYGMIK